MGEREPSLFDDSELQDPAVARDEAAAAAAEEIRAETERFVDGIRRATHHGSGESKRSPAMEDIGFYGDGGESRDAGRGRSTAVSAQRPVRPKRRFTDAEITAARAKAARAYTEMGAPPAAELLKDRRLREEAAQQLPVEPTEQPGQEQHPASPPDIPQPPIN